MKIINMKKIILLVLLGSISNFIAYTQTESNNDSNSIHVVEVMPQFPGGEEAMNKFLNDHLTYPKSAKKQGIQGKVWIGFLVGKDGSISNVEVLKSVAPILDEEAVRVIELMPNWIPGTQDG